jgi:hypothetical protein
VGWINLAVDRDQLQDLVNTAMNPLAPLKGGECLDQLRDYYFPKKSPPLDLF